MEITQCTYVCTYVKMCEVIILLQLCYLHFLTELSWSIAMCFEDLVNFLVKQKI